MKKCLQLTLISFFLLVISCKKDTVVFFCDPYWWHSTSNRLDIKKELTAISPKIRWDIKILVIEEYGKNKNEYFKKNPKAVVYTPLFYSEILGIAREKPNLQIILINGPEKYLAPNVKIIRSDRLPIYQQAGLSVAKWIRTKQANIKAQPALNVFFPEQGETWENNQSLLQYSTAAIFYVGTETRKKEYQRFIQGYEQQGDPRFLSVRTFEDTGKQNDYTNYLNQMKQLGVELFILSAAEQNPTLYSFISGWGKDFIIEDWQASGIQHSRLLYSIEDDIKTIIKKIPATILGKKSDWNIQNIPALLSNNPKRESNTSIAAE